MAHADRVGSTIVLANDPDAGAPDSLGPRIRMLTRSWITLKRSLLCGRKDSVGRFEIYQ